MGIEFSAEQQQLRLEVRDFAVHAVAPHAARWDGEHRLPPAIIRAMGDLGLFGLTAPARYGGSARGVTSLCIAVEEIGRADQSLGVTLSAGVGLGIGSLTEYGTPQQCERYLPDLVAGRALAGFGLTEPVGGSDAAATRTSARHDWDRDEWVIDGAKAFITNSGHELTSLVSVLAATGRREDGSSEISAIIVPAGTPGFVVEPGYDKLGWHASDTHALVFHDCRVPVANLLGQRGHGVRQALALLDTGRIAVSALAVGLAAACLELATDYARTRVVFGHAIGANQGIAFQLADLSVALEAARLLTYEAARLKDAGRAASEVAAAAARAKLHSTQTAVTAARVATQVFGGQGFLESNPVARFYRDAKVLEIGEGTSEMQRLVIARGLGLPVR